MWAILHMAPWTMPLNMDRSLAVTWHSMLNIKLIRKAHVVCESTIGLSSDELITCYMTIVEFIPLYECDMHVDNLTHGTLAHAMAP